MHREQFFRVVTYDLVRCFCVLVSALLFAPSGVFFCTHEAYFCYKPRRVYALLSTLPYRASKMLHYTTIHADWALAVPALLRF